MKKTTILIIVVLFMVIGYAAYNTTINIYGNGKLAENLSDFKVYLSNLKVNGKEVSGINNTKDGFTINDINGDISVDIVNDSTEYDTESYLECVKEDENVGKVWNYDYTGGEQTFTAPISGTYKLETWGAQGTENTGTSGKTLGGYGGYSVGKIAINKENNLYVVVGNKAAIRGIPFNGGGKGDFPGGGATHIAINNNLGELSNYVNSVSSLLMVAGGGGGFFGGGSGSTGAWDCGGGGSGYIGNSLLTEKAMYCYNCAESNETSTKTISTTCVNSTPKENCAKQGNGYARITLLSSPTSITTDKVTITAQENASQSLKNITGKSVTCKLKLNKVSRTKKAYDGPKKWTYDYTGNEQVFTAPVNGTYKFELWGAQGGAYYQAANGGYVSGELVIKKGEKFYVYVGRTGLDSSSTDYVFNYGYQNYIKTGGGATDIRLVNGNWDSLSSLVSRIMVAGGGESQGGLNPTDGGSPYGGSAGGLVGYQGGSCITGNITEHKGAKGVTQTSGHAFGSVPLLNTGGNYFFNNSGGNGYWSGNFYDWVGAGGHNAVSGAGGGSSFISGHTGCVAILSQNSTTPRSDSKGVTCKDGTTDITCSYHYSNIIFKNTIMIDGEGYSWTTVKGKKTSMPSHDGLSTIVGNNSNGYAKITLISQD